MTNIRFVGDLPVWLGLLLAVVVAILSWTYYRRESDDLPHRLRWVLPLLRSLAFALGILILTGPVLHHRKVIGELGKVKIYVDGSQSMGMSDQHASVGRKLLVAEQQGWIEAGKVDSRMHRLGTRLTDVRLATLADLQQETIQTDDVAQMKSRLLSELTSVVGELQPGGTTDTSAVTTDTKNDAAGIAASMNAKLIQPLESINPTAVDESLQQLAELCQAIVAFEQPIRAKFDQDVQLLVDSGDRSIQAALTMFDETPRWRRAERMLLEKPAGLFDKLKANHNVEVLALDHQAAVELWNSLNPTETPPEFAHEASAASTDLASGITSSQNSSVRAGPESLVSDDDVIAPPAGLGGDQSAQPNTAIVLLTDGQHNSGPSPLQAARVLGSQGIAFYPVSIGATQQAPDLAVTGLEHPDMIFQKDRVRGTMVVRDLMPVGQPFVAEVTHDGNVLWQKQLVTQNDGERRIDFEFSIDDVVEKIGGQFDSEVKRHSIPVALSASVSALNGEAESNNNQRMIRLAAITQNYKMLIVDGRSRWETRYLRNVFERDTQWDVDVVIAGPGTDDATLPRGDGKNQFPDNREGLFEYDLIIYGEVAAELFADHEYKWIREFVEIRGGGIVFIDGQRQSLRQMTAQTLGPLLPVEWQSDPLTTQPTMLQLTEKGSREPALAFEVDSTANQRFWNEIPVPHTLRNVTAVPGSETLVEAVVDGAEIPALVTRQYGGGRVLYLGFDETWRWRYKAADLYHQRIWNQLASFVMSRPFAVSDEYVSVDTGPVRYKNGDSADVRIRLLGLDGKPNSNATVDALVWKDGRVNSTVSLISDPDVPGIYRGRTGALTAGDHEVSIRASGFSSEALKARGQFVVLPPESGELDNSACNEILLKQMAAASNGSYLREEHIDQLVELLSPLSSGRVVESDTLLWQSYWWFAAIVILLTLEWFLRKRAGLL